jgi:hypothetical protein
MSMEAMSWAWGQPLRGTKKLVLLALADWANGHGESWHSTGAVAERAGVGRTQVFAALRELEAEGYIGREARERENGSRTTSCYRLNLAPVREPGLGPCGEPNAQNPNRTQRGEETTPVVPAPTLLPSPVEEVWATYAKTMKVRRVMDRDDRQTIVAALKVATVPECQRAIAGCSASDWHMGRDPQTGGRSYKQLTQILKGKRGGRTTREQIDFFIEIADKAGIGSEGVVPVDPAKLSRAKQAVMTAWEFPADDHHAAAGALAREWLAEHGVIVEMSGGGLELGRPTFRSAR